MLIPEFYELKKVVENNFWHNEEIVFNHVLSVLDGLGKIVRKANEKIRYSLDKEIGNNSRGDLLWIATLLHDIAKKETLITVNGIKRCPGHEKKGAEKTKRILKRFDLSEKESRIIVKIVRNHGLVHEIISPDNKNFQKEYKNFKKKFSDIYIELILLALADTSGSYLKKTKPAEFRHRVIFYKKELQAY